MTDLLHGCDATVGADSCPRRPRGPSAVGQEVFLDVVAIGLEQDGGPAQLADLLLGPLDHAVALAAVGVEHLAGAGDLEALFGARLGLDLGHLALLCGHGPWADARP